MPGGVGDVTSCPAFLLRVDRLRTQRPPENIIFGRATDGIVDSSRWLSPSPNARGLWRARPPPRSAQNLSFRRCDLRAPLQGFAQKRLTLARRLGSCWRA